MLNRVCIDVCPAKSKWERKGERERERKKKERARSLWTFLFWTLAQAVVRLYYYRKVPERKKNTHSQLAASNSLMDVMMYYISIVYVCAFSSTLSLS